MVEKFYRMPARYRNDLRCYDEHTLTVIRTWTTIGLAVMPFDKMRHYAKYGNRQEFEEIKDIELSAPGNVMPPEFIKRIVFTFEYLGHRLKQRDGTMEEFEFINVIHNGRIIDIVWKPER